MTRTFQIDPSLAVMWEFIRGDMRPTDFEQWVYSQPDLEERLGKALYLDTLSADYSSKRAVFDIRRSLEVYARDASDLRCECITLPDLADVGMGEHIPVFRTLEQRARRGDPFWWLSEYQCTECEQWWLVASEERQNDVFFLRRLSPQEAERIVKEDRWPSDFDSFERLLRLGLERGHRVRFMDPLNSRSLWWTMVDLARGRPGIHVSELAELLNLDVLLVEEIARRVVREEGAAIDLEPKDR